MAMQTLTPRKPVNLLIIACTIAVLLLSWFASVSAPVATGGRRLPKQGSESALVDGYSGTRRMSIRWEPTQSGGCSSPSLRIGKSKPKGGKPVASTANFRTRIRARWNYSRRSSDLSRPMTPWKKSS